MPLFPTESVKPLIDDIEDKLDLPDNFKADLTGVMSELSDIEGKLDVWPAERGTDNSELEVDADKRAVALALLIAGVETKVDDVEVKLDSPDNFKADVSNLALEATLTAIEHETEWAADAHCDSKTSTNPENLTVGAITPTFPTGSTRVRAILVASIHILNVAANTHHIAFKIEGNKAAGAYSDQLDLTATAQLGLVNLDGSTDSWSGAIDVTTLVDASGSAYNFRFVVTSDNAGEVRYITCFTLVLVYHM